MRPKEPRRSLGGLLPTQIKNGETRRGEGGKIVRGKENAPCYSGHGVNTNRRKREKETGKKKLESLRKERQIESLLRTHPGRRGEEAGKPLQREQ